MKTIASTSFKYFFFRLLLTSIFLFSLPGPVFAQGGYRINVNKNIGFNNGSQIRGDFSISLVGDEEKVATVTFKIDDQELATLTQAPWKTNFKTQSYPDGEHALSAVVTLKDGSTQTVDPSRFNFLSAAEESGAMKDILLPMLGLVFGLMILGFAAQYLSGRGKPAGGPEPGTQRVYGFAGGAICPKCNRPTPRHMTGINIVVGKFDRCENCGKWSIMRAAPIDVLRAAEAAELRSEKSAGLTPEKSQEEKLREMLDESRYTDK